MSSTLYQRTNRWFDEFGRFNRVAVPVASRRQSYIRTTKKPSVPATPGFDSRSNAFGQVSQVERLRTGNV
jgi:hypothetical protein